MKLFLLSLGILFLTACSSMKSGKYVYVESPREIKEVAKKHGVSLKDIKAANPEKSLLGQEWIFIPSKVGITYFLRDTYVVEDYSDLGKGRFLWPVPHFYKVSSHFGQRGRKHHDGIDIPAPKGTPIVSADSGRVIYADNGIRGYGNMIVVAHSDDVFTVYAHNRKNMVQKGDRVKRGEMIAEVGNTGRSTGPHLHFEIRLKNKVQNPSRFISSQNK